MRSEIYSEQNICPKNMLSKKVMSEEGMRLRYNHVMLQIKVLS